MGASGIRSLVANLLFALMLWRHRNGDANRRSVWTCPRNDAIGNIAVVAAALGVFGTAHGWPELVVAAILAIPGLSGVWQIGRQALGAVRGGDRQSTSLKPGIESATQIAT